MEIENQTIYSEVYGVLNVLGKDYINKLPSTIYNKIENGRRKGYVPKYDVRIPLEKQNLKKETVAMLALLNLNYWCSSIQEKEELKAIFRANEDLHQKQQQEKEREQQDNNYYDVNYQVENNLAMVEYKEESLFRKCLNKIKQLLHIGKSEKSWKVN